MLSVAVFKALFAAHTAKYRKKQRARRHNLEQRSQIDLNSVNGGNICTKKERWGQENSLVPGAGFQADAGLG